MTKIFDTTVSFSLNGTKHTRAIEKDHLYREQFENPHVIEADAEKDNTLVVGAVYKGKRRADTDLVEHTMLTIDVDEATWDDFDTALTILRDNKIDFLYYTTVSHSLDHPKFRIFISLSAPVTPVQYGPLGKRIVSILKIPADNCSYVNNQGMYMPMVRVGGLSEYKWEYFEGTPLDVAKHLKAIPESAFLDDSTVDQTYNPLSIPKGVSEAVWMSSICQAYPADDLTVYDDWAHMGMAIYHQTNGKGFDYWMQWSRLGSKHEEKISEEEMHTKWKSFKLNGRKQGVTMRTILNKDPSVLGRAYSIAMSHCEDNESLEKLCKSVSEDDFVSTKSKGIVATQLKTTHAVLNKGAKLERGEALEKITPVASEDDRAWADEWYYCGMNKLMYNINKVNQPIDRDYFNVQFTKRMPPNNNGSKPKAFDAIMANKNGYEMQYFDTLKYAPGEPLMFTLNGETYLNTFKPFPELSTGEFGTHEIDSTIEEHVNKHYKALAGNRPEIIHYLKQHLAWMRMEPAKRIHIGLAVTSELTGIGKSTLKELYSIVLGSRNTNTAGNTELTNTFNTFVAEPYKVTFFEEISLHGKVMAAAMEKLKEYITEDVVSVRDLHKKSQKMHCSTCFVIFSNYTEILGRQGSGRRWSSVTCPYTSIGQLEEIFGMDRHAFFRSYRKLMKDHPDRFIAYFESIDLEGFSTEVPLASKEKEVYHEESPEFLISKVIGDIIESSEHEFIREDVIILQHINQAMKNYAAMNTDVDDNLEPYVRSYRKTKLVKESLKLMGYQTIADQDGEKTGRIGKDKLQYRFNSIWIKSGTDWREVLGVTDNVIDINEMKGMI